MQDRIILHSGEKTPGHANYTLEKLFDFQMDELILPGYPEPLGTVFVEPCGGNKLKCGLDLRPPTPLDPEDVRRPVDFDKCRVPLIFSVPYFSNFAEFFL